VRKTNAKLTFKSHMLCVRCYTTRVKTFIATLSRAFGLHSLLMSYHKSRLNSSAVAMKRFGTETTMPVRCSQRFHHHHQALRRLGFVVEKEFVLQQRPISGSQCYRAFCQLMRVRFPDSYWSCAASGRRVIVTAPPLQMSEWQRFLFEYDQAA
jgi:hypothetical protein